MDIGTSPRVYDPEQLRLTKKSRSRVKKNGYRVSSNDQQKLRPGLHAIGVVSRRASAAQKGAVSGVIDITGLRRGAFAAAMTTASKGDHILYHVGEHCAGAHRADARAAFEGGSVLLTMRKRDHFVFEYIAIPVASKPA
jgi:hypothetical protein